MRKIARLVLLLAVVGAAIGLWAWPRGTPDHVPPRCRDRLAGYFKSTVRNCAKAQGPIRVRKLMVDRRDDKRIEGRAVVSAGRDLLEINFSCRHKSLVGWFPASSSLRRRLR